MPVMTSPTVIETPLPLEPVTRDPFADVSPAVAVPRPAATTAAGLTASHHNHTTV